jgi:ubiquinone/menaquinone biosynthesis C-methylase UbiE
VIDETASNAVDKWAAWLLHRRDGDDREQQKRALEYLGPIRERVLDGAALAREDVLLDVGSGDGLIAFGALRRLGPQGRVIISDVSATLLSAARQIAIDTREEARVSFVEASAETLAPIEYESVDAVTTRSVLIYVAEKGQAFDAFHRVLRPNGRVSIFEPINNYFPLSTQEFWGFDAAPISDLVEKVYQHEGWTETIDQDDPMLNFTEKDLVRHAERAGFEEIHVDLVVDVRPGTWVVDWERMLETSPNPNAHTVREALDGALTREEFKRFERHIRPLADAGRGLVRDACAYLRARKGDAGTVS